jgi:asparagine synthase (glutamine-hydrolysing)
MCGIAGWYRRGGRPVARESIVRQCDRIAHRGPDDRGDFVDGDFGFGMRRLSIIDVASGHQPIATEDGRYSIVLNGEIYNHLELRTELGKAGCAFRTKSDTETLLLAFVHWRDEAWLKLEGMYAAAIWDRAGRILTLARDPLGIKPLYLTEQLGGLAFASEFAAMAGGSDRRQSPDRRLPSHGHDADERPSRGRRGHCGLQRVRLRQPVHRRELGVQHERLGEPDVDPRRARAAPGRPPRRPAEGRALGDGYLISAS